MAEIQIDEHGNPLRFVAFDHEGRLLAQSNEPQEVQAAAQDKSLETGKPVHLYQHVFSVVPHEGT